MLLFVVEGLADGEVDEADLAVDAFGLVLAFDPVFAEDLVTVFAGFFVADETPVFRAGFDIGEVADFPVPVLVAEARLAFAWLVPDPRAVVAFLLVCSVVVALPCSVLLPVEAGFAADPALLVFAVEVLVLPDSLVVFAFAVLVEVPLVVDLVWRVLLPALVVLVDDGLVLELPLAVRALVGFVLVDTAI